jgi:hypothetical protein
MEDNVTLLQSLQQTPASVSINLQTSQLTAMLVALLNSKFYGGVEMPTAAVMKSSVSFVQVSRLARSSALKIELICSSEMSLVFQRTA